MLVRHARTPANDAGLVDTRLPGPGLSDEGVLQAAGLPDRLVAQGVGLSDVDALYVSTMFRTSLTAEPLARATGLTPVVRPGLREISAGTGGRRSGAAGVASYLDLVGRWAAGDEAAELPGGESAEQFFTRYRAVVEEAFAGSARTVVFISHGAALRCWAGRAAINVSGAFAGQNLLWNTETVHLEREPGGPWSATSWGTVRLTVNRRTRPESRS